MVLQDVLSLLPVRNRQQKLILDNYYACIMSGPLLSSPPPLPKESAHTPSIFRAAAVRRYMQGREESVFPRLVSPRTFAYLWILLGLLVGSGLVAWFAQVPVYASGQAIVADQDDGFRYTDDEVVLVAFLPPEYCPQVGQNLLLQFDATGERLSREIIAIEPRISSPNAARERFGLEGNTALAITRPAIVVIARFEPLPTDLPTLAYVGSVYRVDVKIRSRRVISLLPLIGQLFHG